MDSSTWSATPISASSVITVCRRSWNRSPCRPAPSRSARQAVSHFSMGLVGSYRPHWQAGQRSCSCSVCPRKSARSSIRATASTAGTFIGTRWLVSFLLRRTCSSRLTRSTSHRRMSDLVLGIARLDGRHRTRARNRRGQIRHAGWSSGACPGRKEDSDLREDPRRGWENGRRPATHKPALRRLHRFFPGSVHGTPRCRSLCCSRPVDSSSRGVPRRNLDASRAATAEQAARCWSTGAGRDFEGARCCSA